MLYASNFIQSKQTFPPNTHIKLGVCYNTAAVIIKIHPQSCHAHSYLYCPRVCCFSSNRTRGLSRNNNNSHKTIHPLTLADAATFLHKTNGQLAYNDRLINRNCDSHRAWNTTKCTSSSLKKSPLNSQH